MITEIRHPARRFVPGPLFRFVPGARRRDRGEGPPAPRARAGTPRTTATSCGELSLEAVDSPGSSRCCPEVGALRRAFAGKIGAPWVKVSFGPRCGGEGRGAEGGSPGRRLHGSVRGGEGWYDACPVGPSAVPSVQGSDGAGPGSAARYEGPTARYKGPTARDQARPAGTRVRGAVQGSDGAVPGSSARYEAPRRGTRVRRRRTRLRGAGRGSAAQDEGPTAQDETRRRGTRLRGAVQGSDGAVPGSSARYDAWTVDTRVRRRRTRLVRSVRASDDAVPGSSARYDAWTAGRTLGPPELFPGSDGSHSAAIGTIEGADPVPIAASNPAMRRGADAIWPESKMARSPREAMVGALAAGLVAALAAGDTEAARVAHGAIGALLGSGA